MVSTERQGRSPPPLLPHSPVEGGSHHSPTTAHLTLGSSLLTLQGDTVLAERVDWHV